MKKGTAERNTHSDVLNAPSIQDMFRIRGSTLHPPLTGVSSVKGHKVDGGKAGRSNQVITRSVKRHSLDIGSQAQL